MKQLEDRTNGRLAEVLQFVANHDDRRVRDTFLQSMACLAARTQKGHDVILTHDFAPLSMGWEVRDPGGKLLMNGGLIYHPPPREMHPPNFTVHLDQKFYGYSIHT